MVLEKIKEEQKYYRFITIISLKKNIDTFNTLGDWRRKEHVTLRFLLLVMLFLFQIKLKNRNKIDY